MGLKNEITGQLGSSPGPKKKKRAVFHFQMLDIRFCITIDHMLPYSIGKKMYAKLGQITFKN